MTVSAHIKKPIYELVFDSDWIDPPIEETEREFIAATDADREFYGGYSTLIGFIDESFITAEDIDGIDKKEPSDRIQVYTFDKDKIPEVKAKLIRLALQWTELSRAALLKQLEECGQQ